MLNYAPIGVLAIKAIQEQQKKIKGLQAQADSLGQVITELRDLMQEIRTGLAGRAAETSSYLNQNTPNPGKTSTTIKYYLGENTGKARLMITDPGGRIVQTIALQGRGSGQVQLDTHRLNNGVHQYSLYVEGKLIDTKRLVIVK